jgi:hypothetical protein
MKISGFKNLVDVDVRFGPFTCVAGVNGVGKSNLFDAIMFLGALAEKPLIEAAMSVRGKGGRAADVHHLFHRVGENYADKMSFEVEMIIPHKGTDDYGQIAEAGITSLRYAISLAYRGENGDGIQGGLELLHEELERIKIKDAGKHFLFQKAGLWLKSAVDEVLLLFQPKETVQTGSSECIRIVAAVKLKNGGEGLAHLFHLPACPAQFFLRRLTRQRRPPPCWLEGRCSPGGCCSLSPQPCENPTTLLHIENWVRTVPTCRPPYTGWQETDNIQTMSMMITQRVRFMPKLPVACPN